VAVLLPADPAPVFQICVICVVWDSSGWSSFLRVQLFTISLQPVETWKFKVYRLSLTKRGENQ
jgi:hypothetical protein